MRSGNTRNAQKAQSRIHSPYTLLFLSATILIIHYSTLTSAQEESLMSSIQKKIPISPQVYTAPEPKKMETVLLNSNSKFRCVCAQEEWRPSRFLCAFL